MSVPCGFSSSGLPIGLQLLSARFREETLLRVARAYEAHSDSGFLWPTEGPRA